MASFWIREYARVARDANGNPLAAPEEPAITDQQVTISGNHAQSNAFNAATRFVFVSSDSISSYLVGSDPTAVVGGAGRLIAGGNFFFGVAPNQSLKLSAIVDT